MKIFGFSIGDDRLPGELAAAGDAARDRGDWQDAARHYRAALSRDANRADLWVQLGHALKESGDLAAAAVAYESALDRAPDVADTHLQLGHLFKISGRRDAAATAYARAVEIDPSLRDAIEELRNLLRNGARPDASVSAGLVESLRYTRRQRPAPDTPAPERDDRPAAVFDVSDLLGYFHNARLPTGIQRVQIEVISALLREPPVEVQIAVCAFSIDRSDWVSLPADLFLDAARLALMEGGQRDPDWQALLKDIALTVDLSPALAFPQGAWLINLGTSWWLQNYFLKVREAQRLHGIHYLPFVHDMIPVMAPEHCTRPLTEDFISWVQGAFAHTRDFLTNSEASRRDLITVADRLGYAVTEDQVQIVRLDADFRRPGDTPPITPAMDRYGLEAGKFVLMVSTIESRKNHLAAFRAWRDLITRHGAEAVPTLVCVGNRGWLNDGVFARLESDPALQRQVRMLSGVSDADLAGLYQASAFSLYPSQYEGWGLPVTESLSYGKVVLASDSASLPEAGGDFAVYFRQGDQAGLLDALERLIFDRPYRQALEARIAADFSPRPWRALATDILSRITAGQAASAAPDLAIPVANPKRYYPLHRSRSIAVGPGLVAGEIFRAGSGWAAPEDWGCWTRDGDGLIEARVAAGSTRPLRLFIGLRGEPLRATPWRLEVAGRGLANGSLAADGIQWVSRAISPEMIQDGILRLRIIGSDQASMSSDARLDRNSVGVIGFMVCDVDDAGTRSAFVEALATDDLEALAVDEPTL
jgi:glycosyltransferase involved in cell wall biosynthesis